MKHLLKSFLVGALCSNAIALAQPDCQAFYPGSERDQFEFRLPENPLFQQIPQNAVIRRIEIRRFDIFDLKNPLENRWYGRLANRIHPITHESTIRQLLLVREGGSWSAPLAAESERVLRDQVFLYDARVQPLRLCGNQVDVLVIVRDVWTLTGGVSFSRGGGENKSEVFITDANLLGRGQYLSLGRKDDGERVGEFISFRDPHLSSSHRVLALNYADNDDGFDYQFALGLPFYSLDARHSWGLSLAQADREDNLYFRHDDVEEFQHDLDEAEIFVGWSQGLAGTRTRRWRLGLHHEEHRFAPSDETRDLQAVPEDRRRTFPWLEFESVEDDFRRVKNVNSLELSENLYLGESWRLRTGVAGSITGVDDTLWYWEGHYQNAFGGDNINGLGHEPDQLLFLELDGEGYRNISAGRWENLMLSQRWRWFIHPFQRSQWLLEAQFDYTKGMTRDIQLLLGGRTGLRGYPSRFQTGDRRFVLSLEKRYYYDIHLFRLFYLGSAAFVDVGRSWFADRDNGEDGGVLANVGLGLRLTSSRFRSDRVLHLDIAFPLERGDDIDSVQIVLRGQQRF